MVEQREKGRAMPRDDEHPQLNKRYAKTRTGESVPLLIPPPQDRPQPRLSPPARIEEEIDTGYTEGPRKNTSARRYTGSYNNQSPHTTGITSTNMPIRRKTGPKEPDTYNVDEDDFNEEDDGYEVSTEAGPRDSEIYTPPDRRPTGPRNSEVYNTGRRPTGPRNSEIYTPPGRRSTGPRDSEVYNTSRRSTGPRDAGGLPLLDIRQHVTSHQTRHEISGAMVLRTNATLLATRP